MMVLYGDFGVVSGVLFVLVMKTSLLMFFFH